MAASSNKETRKAHNQPYTPGETEMIREFVRKHRIMLECNDGKPESNLRKREAWDQITTDLNTVYGTKRNSEGVKRFWRSLRQRSTKGASQQKKGKSRGESMVSESDDIQSITGEVNPMIRGHPRGYDTSADDNPTYEYVNEDEDEDEDEVSMDDDDFWEFHKRSLEFSSTPKRAKFPMHEEKMIRVLKAETNKHLAEAEKFKAEAEKFKVERACYEKKIETKIEVADANPKLLSTIARSIETYCSRGDHQGNPHHPIDQAHHLQQPSASLQPSDTSQPPYTSFFGPEYHEYLRDM